MPWRIGSPRRLEAANALHTDVNLAEIYRPRLYTAQPLCRVVVDGVDSQA